MYLLPVLGLLFARAAVYSDFDTDRDYADIVGDDNTEVPPEGNEPVTPAGAAAVQAVETQRDRVRELQNDIVELSLMFQTVSGYAIEETDITGEELVDVIESRTDIDYGDRDD